MAIPTLARWQKSTLAASIGGRSHAMGIIDDKIRAYWAAHGNNDRNAMNTAAYELRKGCRHFIDNNPSRLGDINTKVGNLETEANNELTANQPGWAEFAAAKAGGKAGNLKAMAPGYHHERRMYVAEGKTRNPISASQVRNQAHIVAGPLANPDQLIANMDDITWDGYAGTMRAGHMKTDEVLFFDKRARLHHMVLVRNRRLVWARDLTPFDTGNEAFMFAMDAYGNLFAKNDRAGATMFNHSSFNAGREVICAGSIRATGGFLEFISNESGHYQPTRQELWSCMNKLRNANLDTSLNVGGQLMTVRVRVRGVGDWPWDNIGATQGFRNIAVGTAGLPPAAINPANISVWP